MKLDKIKFAKLVQYLAQYNFDGDIETIDDLIDIDVPEAAITNHHLAASDINALMALMAEGKSKIDAIIMHRKLTGWDLKESKEEVERWGYWKNDKAWTKDEMRSKVALLVHSLLVNSDDAKTVISFIESL